MVSLVAVAVFLLCGTLFQSPQVAAFKSLFLGGSLTHREITQLAILRKTAEVCRDIATAQGRDFTLPINNSLTPSAVQEACSASAASSHVFYLAITQIFLSNAVQLFALSEAHHIHNEAFSEGRDLITQGVAAVKASVLKGSYIPARNTLGALCHTLQDFYSHSNWVELGSTAPFSTLIKPELPLNNLAGPSTPTCRSCTGSDCRDNILPEILLRKKLTSGYFSVYSSRKPADFGPLTRTTNADIFKERINSLSADGGGDEPEMCLSGLLVTFMLTNVLLRRRRTASQSQQFKLRSDIQLYRDLAHASGGQAITVTKATLSQATAVITDASTSALVTVLQVVRSPIIAENVSFVLDPSLSNVTVYITGDSPVFTLYSPTGVSQSGSVADGPLGSILTVGNLNRVKLNSDSQTGEWKISIDSTHSYSLKVIGQSSVNFLINFVEQLEGGDFTPKANRPFIGRNATLFVSVTGGDSVSVTDVLLVEASGSDVVHGTIKSLGATDFLVNIDRIPEWAFVVQLKGLLNDSTRSSPSRFQRQSPTQQRGSGVNIMAQPNNTIEPGIPFNLNFTLVTNATGGSYTIRAWTDRSFSVSFPSSLDTGTEGSAQGSVTLTARSDTESGTDVTLTIEAEDSESSDSNYVVLRFTVMTKVTDFSSPVCQVVSIKADCPVECSKASWELSANLTDGNGTGIANVSLSRGNGSLSLSYVMSADGTNVTVASYNASCCSQEVELVAVDRLQQVESAFVRDSLLQKRAGKKAAFVTRVRTGQCQGGHLSRPRSSTTRMDCHLQGHTELNKAARQEAMLACKRKKALKQLADLQASNPMVAMISTLDLRDDPPTPHRGGGGPV
ncbi:hypothetical protein G5714_002803 [Onychostoma macrolepis]|uniref:von Willebrand factor A domain-containing protein 7 n=1 Tax=Onychostoma macrolepis TaxID=369639 RepID=A0A7J6D8U2_9TELE|nr:hypothetical protein G5714_002803 [Onychostoma macrolepis]